MPTFYEHSNSYHHEIREFHQYHLKEGTAKPREITLLYFLMFSSITFDTCEIYVRRLLALDELLKSGQFGIVINRYQKISETDMFRVFDAFYQNLTEAKMMSARSKKEFVDYVLSRCVFKLIAVAFDFVDNLDVQVKEKNEYRSALRDLEDEATATTEEYETEIFPELNLDDIGEATSTVLSTGRVSSKRTASLTASSIADLFNKGIKDKVKRRKVAEDKDFDSSKQRSSYS